MSHLTHAQDNAVPSVAPPTVIEPPVIGENNKPDDKTLTAPENMQRIFDAFEGLEEESDVFYDGDTTISGEEAKAPPVRVDPREEPGQRFVIVENESIPNSVEAMIVSGNRALKLGRYASAMDIFEQLHRKNSRDPRILMGLGVSQQHTGFTQSAIQTYERLLEIDQHNETALVNLLGLKKNKNPETALRQLLELRKKYPKNPAIPAQIGFVNAELGHYEDAMRFFGVAASIEPKNAGHLYNMAIIADRQKQKDNAVRFYKKALEIDATYSNTQSVPRDAIYDRLAQLRKQ